jgi:hypothetical protein
MKYMLLMQSSQENAGFPEITTWSPEEIRRHIAFMQHDAMKAIAEAGELVDAQGLAFPDQARIVRAAPGGGAPLVTEGPFPETKEFLAGYWIVELPGVAEAVELAAFLSTAPGPGGKPLNMPIEVRQVLSAPPQELTADL